MSRQEWSNDSGDDVQMPLGVGDAPVEELELPSKPKVNALTLLLFAAFATALLVIYLVGSQTRPKTASAEQIAHQQEVQSAITELLQKNGKSEQLKGILKDTDKLVKMFYSYLDGDTGAVPELSHVIRSPTMKFMRRQRRIMKLCRLFRIPVRMRRSSAASPRHSTG